MRSDGECAVCGRARGFLHHDKSEPICPWCIAAGAGSNFNDCGLDEGFREVPDDVVTEIEDRTPGFPRWQSERWLAHCGDGMVYLGEARHELLERYPDARETVEAALGEWQDVKADDYLDPEVDAPSAYVFRCRACGTFRAFCDWH